MKIKINPRTKYDLVIGIDPDVDKSGLAIINTNSKEMELHDMTFYEMCRYFDMLAEKQKVQAFKFVVIIEAGWKNVNNWHLGFGDNSRTAAKKGEHVGRNKQVGLCLTQYAKDGLGLPVIEQKPLRKIWKGRGKKITAEELEKLTGYSKQSNQEKRDAALLAYFFASY